MARGRSPLRQTRLTKRLKGAFVYHHWGEHYTRVARSVIAGNWATKPMWGGIKDGLVQLSAMNPAVPAEVRALIDARRKAIVAGSFKPFAAPLADNEGLVRLTQGALDDGAIATMNWFVQGVVGTLPTP